MFSISNDARILLYGTPADLRNGFDGLSFLAQTCFNHQILPDTYVVFINPRRTRMKILYWTGTNLSIWYIRLRNGVFFHPGHLNSRQITKFELENILNQKMPNSLFLPAKKDKIL